MGTHYSRAGRTDSKQVFAELGFPWVFVVLMVLNSLGYLPERLASAIQLISSSLLIAAIAAIGFRTQPVKLRGNSRSLLTLIELETILIGLLAAALAA